MARSRRTMKYLGLVSLLGVLAVVMALGLALPAHADKPTFSINITLIQGGGGETAPPYTNPIYVEGNASARDFPGQLSQYDVQIDWGDEEIDDHSNVDFDPSDGDFSGTWNSSLPHPYAAGGTYNITVKLYHQQPPGNEAGDAARSVIIQMRYTLTVASNGCCSISVDTDTQNLGNVNPGDTGIFNAIPYGTNVNLTANDSAICCDFDEWTVDGSAVGGNPINITMDADHTANATCSVPTYNLTITSDGCCNVSVVWDGGSGSVAAGAMDTFAVPCCNNVTLTADDSDPCCDFVNWTGNVSGSANPVILHMDSAKNVTANCTAPQFTLTTNANPAEGGSVTGGGTYDCCTDVQVEAIPADECWYFTGWSGNLSGTENPTNIHMDGDKDVTANFAKIQYTLTMQVSGSGTTTPPVGSHEYAKGTVVNISASPQYGWRFYVWTGDVADPNSATTNVTMDANKTVTATFIRRPVGGGVGVVGPACPETLTVDFLGEITETPMTRSGILCDDCVAPSPDEMHLLEIEENIKVLDSEGKVVTLIEITEATPPSLPASTVIVGSAYNFSPSGITFSKPVNLTLGYNVGDLPEDMLAISMGYYSSEDGWTELETKSSQVAEVGSLTGTMDHFSVFAILADLPSFELSDLSITPSRTEIWDFLTFAVRTGEEAVITVDVVNTGNHEASYTVSLEVNGEIKATQEIIKLAPGLSETVKFTISGNEQGQYEIVVSDLSGELTSSLWVNWWLIGDILAVVAVIVLLAAWWYRKRGKPAPVE